MFFIAFRDGDGSLAWRLRGRGPGAEETVIKASWNWRKVFRIFYHCVPELDLINYDQMVVFQKGFFPQNFLTLISINFSIILRPVVTSLVKFLADKF